MIMTWVTPRLDIGGGQDLFCPSCAKIEENAYKTLQAALLLDGWLIWQVYGGCKGATLGLRLLLHSPRKGIWVNYGDFLLIGPKQKYRGGSNPILHAHPQKIHSIFAINKSFSSFVRSQWKLHKMQINNRSFISQSFIKIAEKMKNFH